MGQFMQVSSQPAFSKAKTRELAGRLMQLLPGMKPGASGSLVLEVYVFIQ
jgi:hypothetical protein